MSTPRKEDEAPVAAATKTRKPAASRKPAAAKARAEKPLDEETIDEAQGSNKPLNVKTTLYLPKEISEGCRDAVIYLAGHPEYLTLTTLIENALRRELERLQAVYTEGKPFPRRRRDLRAGRPFGS